MDGFLADPERRKARTSELSSVYSVDALTNRCVAFLGEPSSGKSRTIGAEGIDRASIEEFARSKGDFVQWIDLRDFDSSAGLSSTLRTDTTIQNWRHSQGAKLHLFLDSLDECRISIPIISNVLPCELRSLGVEQLFLRIICRTAEWPTFLEMELQKLYQEELLVLQLAPLRECDIEEAARVLGLDPDKFLGKVRELSAISFARKPPTLLSLLQLFSRGESFPATQWELFESQCRILCEEYNQSRIAAHKASSLSAEQLLEVVSRIAAVSVLTDRPTLCMEPNLERQESSALRKSELSGGEEIVGNKAFAVGESEITQAFETGLFVAAGRGLLRWETRNLAEFLAGRYLICREPPGNKILSVICHPRDMDRKLIPQLHNLSVWLAERREDIFAHIAAREVEVLLAMDATALTDIRKEVIVEGMLNQAAAAQLQLRFGGNWRYGALGHPGIVERVRRTLRFEEASIEAKIVACELALTCGLRDLAGDFQELGLSESTPRAVRILAILGVGRFGDAKTRGTLHILLEDARLAADEDDELRGAVLRALWPDHLSFQQLLPFLTAPKRPNLGGLYSGFLRDEVAKHLPPKDLLQALGWAKARPNLSAPWTPESECVSKLICMGLESMRDPEVRKIMGEIAYSRASRHEDLLPAGTSKWDKFLQAWGEDDELRRSLVAEMLSLVKDPEREWVLFIARNNDLLRANDFEWLLNLGVTTSVANTRVCCSFLVPRFLTFTPGRIKAFYAAVSGWPELRRNGFFLLDPINIVSDLARDLRASMGSERKRAEANQRSAQLGEALSSIERVLERESDESWVDLAWWLENSGVDEDRKSQPVRLSRTRAWSALAPAKRAAILDAAKRYVLAGDPRNEEWFGTQGWPFSAVAGYEALFHLLQFEPEFLDGLSADRWGVWIPVLMTYFHEGSKESANKLLKVAYSANRSEFLLKLSARVHSEAAETYVFVVSNVERVWDKAMAEVLVGILKEPLLPIAAFQALLSSLLKHDDNDALEHAMKCLQNYLIDRASPEHARAAAEVLLDVKPKQSWSVLWEIFMVDEEFAKRTIEQSAYSHFMASPLLSSLNEEEIGKLFRWMLERYPLVIEDTRGGAVTPRFATQRLRDGLVERLATCGTYEAIEVLKSLQEELPQFPWPAYLVRAELRARERSWTPPTPENVIELLRLPKARFAAGAEDLLEIVVEALDQIQLQLRAETPAVSEVWNYSPGRDRVYSPKDENDIANWLKRRLEENIVASGIVIGREVEIRRIPGATGQRTDLQVWGARPGSREKTVVVIEVKGCWHSDLKTSMEMQLVNRYLRDNFYTHGVYVVGWFRCAQWGEADVERDYRSGVVPFEKISEAEAYFSHQATALSKDRIRVRGIVLDMSLPSEATE